MTRKQKQINMKRVMQKLYEKKYADLVDRHVKECIQKKENYEIEYRGKSMTLTPEELQSKCLGRQYIEKPKYGTNPYHILYYKWEPTKSAKDDNS